MNPITSTVSANLGLALEPLVGSDAISVGGPDDAIDHVVPSLVLRPDSVEKIQSVVKVASRDAATIAPVGGRTRIDLGNPPKSIDMMVDTTRVNRLVRHTPDDLTAAAEAGVTVAQLQRSLAEYGQFVAINPPLPDRATLGGTIAVGLSGPLKWSYGNVRDVVIGLTVIQADGNLTKSGGQVVKNVSGYDLVRMHVGAFGTLGIITELSLKLTPLPRRQRTLLARFETVAEAYRAGLAIFHSDVIPLAMTDYDEETGRRIEGPDIGSGAYLAIRLGGRPLTLDRQVRECGAVLANHNAAAVDEIEEDPASTLWRRLADFGWDARTKFRLLARAMLKPTAMADVAGALASDDPGLRTAIIGQPAHGTLSVGWYGEDGLGSVDDLAATVSQARRAVEERGGRLVIERCATEVKTEVGVWGEVGSNLETMRRLKSQFDPNDLFNPGRYVGGI